MRAVLIGIALALAPAVGAQTTPAATSDVAALLAESSADSVAQSLGPRFTESVVDLAPDMTEQDRSLLSAAVAQAFEPARVRADIVGALAKGASPAFVSAALAARTTGALAELARIAASYAPPTSLAEFNGTLPTIPRERVQLAAALVEAEGAGDFNLNIEETIRRTAHQLVTVLGGTPEPFVPLPQPQFEASYRDRTLVNTIALLYRDAPASDDLIRRATAEFDSDAGRWYVEGYSAAIAAAIASATERVVRLTASSPEPAATDAAAPTPPVTEADTRTPCRAAPCLLSIQWSGRPPAYNQTFGNAGDLANLVVERLSQAGYQVAAAGFEDGRISIVLRPRTTMGLCGMMSGTDNRGCPAIDQVTVEFTGATPGVETPKGFTVRNRCGGEGLLAVDGVAYLVAARVNYALTTSPGDKRPLPTC